MTSNVRSRFVSALPMLVLGLACAGAVQCVRLEDSEGVSKQWGAAERLDDAGAAVDVAVDADGNAIAVWTQRPNGIWASRYTRGRAPAWSAPAQINLPPSLRVDVLDRLGVAMDAHGNAVAVWAQFFQRDNVHANRSTPDGSWDTFSVGLDDDAGDGRSPPDSGPQVSMNADGVAVAVWVQVDSSHETVWAVRATLTEPWGAAQRVETIDAVQASGPQVAVDLEGNAIVVWAMADGVSSNVWFNRYASGTGWGADASRVDEDEVGDAEAPQVAVDAQGSAIAVWSQLRGETYDIWASRYVQSLGRWGDAEGIGANAAGDAVDPQVAVDANGNAVAAWSQFDGAINDIWASRYAPDTGWGAPQRIEENDEGSALAPDVAVDDSGAAVVVWRQLGGEAHGIWANRCTLRGNWREAGPIDAGGGFAGNPRVAMDPSGNAVAVWTVSLGVNKGVWSNHLE